MPEMNEQVRADLRQAIRAFLDASLASEIEPDVILAELSDMVMEASQAIGESLVSEFREMTSKREDTSESDESAGPSEPNN